jgi:carbon monoxide dehydrogenase subunit G
VDIYSQMAQQIIEQQEVIIGPVAVEQANQIEELNIDWPNHSISIDGNGAATIDKLVNQYKKLFGQISVEASRQAAAKLLAQLPAPKRPKTLV